MKKSKRIISLILSLIIMLSITAGLNFSAYATSSSGSCGDNIRYTFDRSTGKLVISGTGAMPNYNTASSTCSPFYSGSDIKSIVIYSGVTNIGSYAFADCYNLTNIIIPNSVTKIGSGAFVNCRLLTNITIPNSVTNIGKHAFQYCSSLTEITIPNSVTNIGNDAFDLCTDLTRIIVDKDNTIYDSRNNCNAIIETNSNTLIQACKNTIIPSSVTSIGERAFRSCKELTSITIPYSVTSIGSEAFRSLNNLNDVYYLGSESDWNNIEIGSNNDYLTKATIHYHNHTYSIVDEDKKTCIILYRCECGKEYKEFVDDYHTCDSFVGIVDGELCYSCSVCKSEYTKSASEIFEKWDSSVINASAEEYPELDVVNDGIINAKDYALLNHIKNYGY